MLRALLTDRFKMMTHYEDKPVAQAYTLVSVKPRMKKADSSNRSNCKEASVVARDPRDINPKLSRLVTCQNLTMRQFAQQLQVIAPEYISYESGECHPNRWRLGLHPGVSAGSPNSEPEALTTACRPVMDLWRLTQAAACLFLTRSENNSDSGWNSGSACCPYS